MTQGPYTKTPRLGKNLLDHFSLLISYSICHKLNATQWTWSLWGLWGSGMVPFQPQMLFLEMIFPSETVSDISLVTGFFLTCRVRLQLVVPLHPLLCLPMTKGKRATRWFMSGQIKPIKAQRRIMWAEAPRSCKHAIIFCRLPPSWGFEMIP